MNTQSTQTADGFVGDVFLDADTFAKLKHGTEHGEVAASILRSLSRLNDRFQQIVLVLSDGAGGKMQPAGIWPTGATPEKVLLRSVQDAARAGRMVLENADGGLTGIGLPVSLDGRPRGIFGVLLQDADDTSIRTAIDQLQWASGWVEAMLRRRRLSDGDAQGHVIELLATSLHHKRFQEAATAVATELAGVLGCERVSIGFLKGRHARVRAVSHSATFHKKAGLIAGIQAAMNEAIDQQALIRHPEPEDGTARITRAHADLARAEGTVATASLPLTEGKRVIGALTLERAGEDPFTATELQTAEYAAALLGPVLEVKRREDRWLPAKTWDAFKNLLAAIIGPRHWGLKLGLAALIAFAAFCYYATGEYRITAQTVLEGKVQRAVTAPLGGFLSDAPVRAGDLVQQGDIVARLDDRDLRLERLKWASQQAQQERELSQAVANRQRTEARILESQIAQAAAQLELLDSQIERMTIRAPFSGVVVSGDLSQALGAPLERGDVLFEVAPLSDYRVMLRVDERDIRDIDPGQTGSLVLSAFPDADIGIEVQRITPISTAAEGQNFFVVEAELTGDISEDLRPGMEGIAKVGVREERLVNIWTKRTWLWLRMTAWKWWP